MNNAWIAITLTWAVALVGCKSEQEATLEPVPPPNYATPAEPEPLPPISISGQTGTASYTPAPAAEPEPLPLAAPANRTYTIRKGDTLWSIATREYGSGQKWKSIAQANPSIDPKKLMIGQQIVLP